MKTYVEKPFKQRTDLHLVRKVWHVAGVLGLVIVYNLISRPFALQLISLVTVAFVTCDVLRQFFPKLNQGLLFFFHPFMREHERNQLAGTTYLLLGVLIIMAFFPQAIVTLSLLFLAIADPLASLVGILYGRDKILNQKSFQGTLAAFAACTLISALYFYFQNWMTERFVIVSLLGGGIGAFAELVPFFNIDDNLTFPVISSILLFILFWIFGGF